MSEIEITAPVAILFFIHISYLIIYVEIKRQSTAVLALYVGYKVRLKWISR